MSYALKKVAVICVFEKEGKFLFLKRAHTGAADGFYMFPGGHVDEGEALTTAAVRELKEELAITVSPKDLAFALVEPTPTHINFFFRVKAFQGTLQNNEPQKHSALAFLSPDAPDIHPFTRREILALQKGEHFISLDMPEAPC